MVLIGSYLVIASAITLSSAYLARSFAELRMAETYLNTYQSFYSAEAGANRTLQWLRSLPGPPSGIEAFDPFENSPDPSYSVSVDPYDGNPTNILKRYRITARGFGGDLANPKAARQVIMEVEMGNFAQYVYATDSEKMPWNNDMYTVWFVTRDQLDGPAHTNGQMNISGDPVFEGQVTTVDSSLNYMHGGPPEDNPEFNGSLELGSTSVTLPSRVTELRSAAATGGLTFSGDTLIQLNADGTMTYTNFASGQVNVTVPVPNNGAVFVDEGELHVWGTVDGSLTVGASGNIFIEDNLVYKDNPVSVPESDDYLGIISESNVLIPPGAPDDLYIHGSVMALSDYFSVEEWYGDRKGTLHLYGGVIQKHRGAVGSFDSRTNEIVSGYQKDYHHDPRFKIKPPPYYPDTGAYRVLMWAEQ
ncbi:MAG: DUF4900 domain-containing protein [Candidatus Omnitrophica bacterium]|nr:DUF4900 domain-containing protein [Candidatus Omnitrophota bacterium]